VQTTIVETVNPTPATPPAAKPAADSMGSEKLGP
jgi:hypothetical protein